MIGPTHRGTVEKSQKRITFKATVLSFRFLHGLVPDSLSTMLRGIARIADILTLCRLQPAPNFVDASNMSLTDGPPWSQLPQNCMTQITPPLDVTTAESLNSCKKTCMFSFVKSLFTCSF